MSEGVGDPLEDWRGMGDQKKVKKAKKKKTTTSKTEITTAEEIEDVEEEVGHYQLLLKLLQTAIFAKLLPLPHNRDKFLLG